MENHTCIYTILAYKAYHCTSYLAFGFLETRLEAVERGQRYLIEIGYIKPPNTSTIIRGDITIAKGGTAGEFTVILLIWAIYSVRPQGIVFAAT